MSRKAESECYDGMRCECYECFESKGKKKGSGMNVLMTTTYHPPTFKYMTCMYVSRTMITRSHTKKIPTCSSEAA